MSQVQQPTEAEILAALASYRQHIVKHNKKVFTILFHLAETTEPPPEDRIDDWTDDVVADARLQFMLDQLCEAFPDDRAEGDPRRIKAPRDVLDRWDDLVAIAELGLDGTNAGVKLNSEVDDAGLLRPVLREQYRAGIEAALQKMPDPPSPLFPYDFSVLMEHVDSLTGPGWPLSRKNGEGLSFWEGLGETQEAVMKRVCTDGEKLKNELGEPTWDVRCGWECGQGAHEKCLVVYFRDTESGRPGGWRYVIQGHGTLMVFYNVVELLNFYKKFNQMTLDLTEVADVAGDVFYR